MTTAIKEKPPRPGKDDVMEKPRDKWDGFAKDEATDWIRELILSGELRAGELISENMLVERFAKERPGSLSRTPIRQALARLAAEGLVEIMPRFGTRVRLVHADDAVKIMGLRYAIETVVVCKLAHECARVDLAPLVALVDSMEEYTKEDRPLTTEEKTRFVRAEIDFHTKLAELAGYGPAIEPLRAFSGQFLLAAILSIHHRTARRGIVEEHRAIIAAVRSENEESARDAMHRHLYSTLDRWSPYSSEYLRKVVPSYFRLGPLQVEIRERRRHDEATEGGPRHADKRPARR